MKVNLVTGGAGFIGSHLVRALLARGAEVRVLDDLSTGSEANLADLNIDLKVADVRDEAAMMTAMKNVETVFHLAAFVSVPASVKDPVLCYQTNVLGSLNVLEAAKHHGVRRVVMASSAAIYGERSDVVSEEDRPLPVSPYADSKLAMENLARMFFRAYGLETVSLRFFNVFGPRQSPHSTYAAAIPRFIQDLIDHGQVTILGDGSQTRDFVYIDDVIQGIVNASEVASAAGEIFNLAGGTSVSILELVGILHRFFPEAKEPNYGPAREGDIQFSQADVSRANQALGYRREVEVEEGLRRTVEWFQSTR